MSWNGSDQTSNAAREGTRRTDTRCAPASGAQPSRAVASSRRPYLRGALAGLVVVALLGAAVWYFLRPAPRKSNNPTIKQSNNSHISEVKPAVAATNVPAKPSHKIECKVLADGRIMEYRDGKPLWLFPHMPPNKKVFTNDTARANQMFEEKVFKNAADVHIAVLLNTEPGEGMVGDPESYYMKFDQQFKKALLEPIQIDPSDPDDVKALKEGVIAARTELKRRMDAGEDVKDVMCESFRELQELGLYKTELENQVRTIIRDGKLTEKDFDDLLGAANQMLESRGARPLKMTSVLKYKARKAALKGKKKQ